MGLSIALVRDGPADSGQRSSPVLKRWRVSRPSNARCRCRGGAQPNWLARPWPRVSTAQLVHLPIHASWLNQIEIVFSIIQRKVIKPADFANLAALADRLRRFENRYNGNATPFDWRFTTADLTAMLERVDTSNRHAAALAA